MRNAYSILVEKPEKKRTLGRPRGRCEGNTGMSLREIGWAGVDWKYLSLDRDQWWALVQGIS
jgi:hypothetical protein